MAEKSKNYLIASMADDNGFDIAKELDRHFTVVIGGCNSIHAQTVVKVSGESLTNLADLVKSLPPESVKDLTGPLLDIIRAAGIALNKIGS